MTSNPAGNNDIFLGRQPVLNRQGEIIGYELLFRSSEENRSVFNDQNIASASVIANALSAFGLREVIGEKLGFINVSEEVLFSESLELLPKEQTILELLETIPFSKTTRERAIQLQQQGFRLALDDHVYLPEHSDLYPYIHIVKINLLTTPPEELHSMTQRFTTHQVVLLAECVETREQFEQCLELGFELFQGYFFSRPVVIRKKNLESSKAGMIRLLDRLKDNANLGDIEDIFRDYPDISYNMLKLVNSIGMGLREKIKNLRHAIMLLGLENLRRWALLAIFASMDSRGINNPLLEMAGVRGRLMEHLLLLRPEHSKKQANSDEAFMTGIISLMDVLFETDMELIVKELHLSDEISRALLNRDGNLGSLLALAETLEMVNFGQVQEIVQANHIPLANLMKAQLSAYKWRQEAGVTLA